MSRTRVLLSAPALVLALGLTACSGDGDDDTSGADSTPTHAPDSSDRPVGAQVRQGCTAEGAVTGAITATWSGKASVRTDEGAPTVYTAEDGTMRVTAYSAADGFETTANVTGPDGTLTTGLGDATGLDIDPDGAGGTVDAALVGLDDNAGHLVATFTCAEPKGKGKGKDQTGTTGQGSNGEQQGDGSEG